MFCATLLQAFFFRLFPYVVRLLACVPHSRGTIEAQNILLWTCGQNRCVLSKGNIHNKRFFFPLSSVAFYCIRLYIQKYSLISRLICCYARRFYYTGFLCGCFYPFLSTLLCTHDFVTGFQTSVNVKEEQLVQMKWKRMFLQDYAHCLKFVVLKKHFLLFHWSLPSLKLNWSTTICTMDVILLWVLDILTVWFFPISFSNLIWYSLCTDWLVPFICPYFSLSYLYRSFLNRFCWL